MKLEEKTKELVSDCIERGIKLPKPLIDIINIHNSNNTGGWLIGSLNDISTLTVCEMLTVRGIGYIRFAVIKDLLACAGMSFSKTSSRRNEELDKQLEKLISENLTASISTL